MQKELLLPKPNVLVFFGSRADLAEDLVDILKGLGCDASTVNELPADGLGLSEKVSYYLAHARFCIAIATRDSRRKAKFFPAETLVNELTLCLDRKKGSTFVLLEAGTELPSTLVPTTFLEFKRDRFQTALPSILKTLRTRGLLGKLTSTEDPAKDPKNHSTLVHFTNRMNELWDMLGDTWNFVYKTNVPTEARIASELDEFFVAYYLGFAAATDIEPPTEPLSDVLRRKIEDAERNVTNVMADVLQWRFSKLGRRVKKTKKRLSMPLRKALVNARMAEAAFATASTFSTKRSTSEKAMKDCETFLDA